MSRKKWACGIVLLVMLFGTLGIVGCGVLTMSHGANFLLPYVERGTKGVNDKVKGAAKYALSPFVSWFSQWTKDIDDEPSGVAYFDSFGGGDYERIALIEPYQAISIDREFWEIELAPDLKGYRDQIWVTTLDVVGKQIIVAYASGEHQNREHGAADEWYVIIPSEHVEKTFTNKQDFFAYLKTKGVTQINLREGNELYSTLVKTGYLEWYPDEYQK